MIRIPPAALLLSIAGLAPFLLGALLSLGILSATPEAIAAGSYHLILGSDGPLIMARYGVVILCFMAGALWGVATKATGLQASAAYVLAILPALWAFLNPGTTADATLINLMIGFAAVLMLDLAFYRWQLAPEWWMSLRLPVTIVVVICLAIGVWA